MGNAVTDNVQITSFDIQVEKLAVSYFVATEDRAYIMLYDLMENQVIWNKYKSNTGDNKKFEGTSFLTK